MHQTITFERWSDRVAGDLPKSTGEAFVENESPPGASRWASANFAVTATPGEDSVSLEIAFLRAGGSKRLDPVALSQDGANKGCAEVMRAIRDFRLGK